MPVASSGGQTIPLKELADIRLEETPPTIEHEGNRRRTFISANVRGRDVASFVVEAQRTVAEQVTLDPGYELRWGGDFENLQSASRRLAIITPIVLIVIMLLLHTSLGSLRLAFLIFLAVPMAASGGVIALALREMPFSISAGVGFIALFGVAVLNGLVWVSAAENLRESGRPLREVSQETALVRLRPVLMTALVASLGFLPMDHVDAAHLTRRAEHLPMVCSRIARDQIDSPRPAMTIGRGIQRESYRSTPRSDQSTRSSSQELVDVNSQ